MDSADPKIQPSIYRVDDIHIRWRRNTRTYEAICNETLKALRNQGFFWQESRDSNPRPTVLETATLPTELHSYVIPHRTNRIKAMNRIQPTRFSIQQSREGCQPFCPNACRRYATGTRPVYSRARIGLWQVYCRAARCHESAEPGICRKVVFMQTRRCSRQRRNCRATRLDYGFGELIGTRSGLVPAADAFQDFRDFHGGTAIHKLHDGFQVSVAPAFEPDVLKKSPNDLEPDFRRARAMHLETV
jgi:hypothetical protein